MIERDAGEKAGMGIKKVTVNKDLLFVFGVISI